MASEDVIELGSSEDEAEPAPKKIKPIPNAMVHIPKKVPEKSKKQLKSTTTFISKVTDASSKNIKPIMPIQIQKPNLTKPNVIRQKANLVSNHIPGMKIVNKNINLPVTNNKMPSRRLKNPMALQKSKLPINLPPCITVKPLSKTSISSISNKQLSVASCKTKNKKSVVGDVLTVELDDEEDTKSVPEGPQWYLRPEEHKNCSSDIDDDKIELSIEEQNNKEPEKQKFVEITIEDSPVKQLQLKHTEIGKELPITIEDSPIKPVSKNYNIDESDDDNEKSTSGIPQSKKKLKYPKGSNAQKQVVEIEIEMMQTSTDSNNISKDNTEQDVTCAESNKVKELPENTKKTPMVEVHNSKDSSNDVLVIDTKDKDDEFHPTYQKFIDTCFELENSDDMKKIVDKKIKTYYKQSPKEYVESEEFIEMVTSKIISMKAGPDKMYLYIKDIVDELNLQRKSKKTIILNTDNKEEETSEVIETEKNECNDKRQRQIRKLEKTIKNLYRAIQKLEEQEVDFDDEEDSVYLLTERYKERMVRVHEKLCQITNTKMPSEPRIHIEVRPGRPEGAAKRLEMWINKKVPIGTPLPFPDFHDVLKCVREANIADSLGWNEVDIMEEARDLFTRCGKKLQRRRQENEWRIASSRVSHHVDPAANSSDLRKHLEENKSLAAKKESEVFNKYVERQNQLKLEAEEIGDKEADESPVESEEDEDDVVELNTSQELKQIRRERIKLLLKETRKNEEKENNPLPPEQPNIECEINEDQSKHVETNMNPKELNKSEFGEQLCGTQSNKDTKVTDIDDEMVNMSNEADCISCNDDLNLLSELYSENRSIISSDLSSSDPLDSDSDAENRPIVLSDVISIENSSYSESESMDGVKDDVSNLNPIDEDDVTADEIPTISIENNTEDMNIIDENILLGSSDDDNSQVSEIVTCINLKDDNISITETTLDGDYGEKEDVTNLEINSENTKTADDIDCRNLKEINTKVSVDSVINEKEITNNKNISLNALEAEVDNDKNVYCLSKAVEDSVTEVKAINGNEKDLLDNNASEMQVDDDTTDNNLFGEAMVQCTEDTETDMGLDNMATTDLQTNDGSNTNLSFIERIDFQVEIERTMTPSLNSVEQLNNAGHSDLNVNDKSIENNVINEASNELQTIL